MRFLLDTHVLLWYLEGSPKLAVAARELIEDAGNEVVVSVATLWEAAIKVGLGKLRSPEGRSFRELIEQRILPLGFEVLGIEPTHLDALLTLPFHHRDPFDRLLIAQAVAEESPILTEDGAFAAYPVRLLSA